MAELAALVNIICFYRVTNIGIEGEYCGKIEKGEETGGAASLWN